ncbi:MAG: DUF4062 domain-containing protein, partial [Candidatus Heimdallarchaeota archaeon]|nr:DUF4062 domain-containing protein [Candidatus Heimdallarchaeota archaeon]
AYGTLAEVENPRANCQKAIEAYEEALKVFGPETYPQAYARTQLNLRNTYRTLAEVENTRKNLRGVNMGAKLEKGLIRVFLSSTFRNLEELRKKLIEKFGRGIITVCMERFVPNGTLSQEVSLEDLKSSEIAIFLFDKRYGSPIKNGCQYLATCPSTACIVKRQPNKKISYTHCEYLYTLAMEKPHWCYFLERKKGGEPEQQLIDLKQEIKEYKTIKENDLEKITDEIVNHLVVNLLEWYVKKYISFNAFCGRRKTLKKLVKALINCKVVEVVGVGGIGKTTLCDVGLLLCKLLGKEVVYFTAEESYASENGYKYRHKKIPVKHVESLTLDVIAEGLGIENIKDRKALRAEILARLESGHGTILFLDNYQEDSDIEELIKTANNRLQKGAILLSAKKKLRLTTKELALMSVEERAELVKYFAGDEELPQEEIERIAELSEGHPVMTFLLVKNKVRLDFSELESIKEGLSLADSKTVKEYMERVIEKILSKNALEVLKALTLIEEELDRKSIYEALPVTNLQWNAAAIFGELVDTFLLRLSNGKLLWTYNQIKDALFEEKSDRHELAINYYKRKEENYGKQRADTIEKWYHLTLKNKNTLEIEETFEDLYNEIVYNENLPQREKLLLKLAKWAEVIEFTDRGAGFFRLGYIYNNLADYRDAKKRILKAIIAYEEALQIFNLETHPQNYATIHINLGATYQELAMVDNPRPNCQKAIKAYEEALKVFSFDATPQNYAKTQLNLGNAYQELAAVDDSRANCQKAIKAYEEALKVYNLKAYPQAYASTQLSLGAAYNRLAEVDEPRANCQKAIKAYEEALKVFTPETYPQDYASIQLNLGIAYQELAAMKNKQANCKKAREAYKEAFKVCNKFNLDHLKESVSKNLAELQRFCS